MSVSFRKMFRHTFALLSLALLVSLVSGFLHVGALTSNTNYVKIDFNSGEEETDPDVWTARGDINSLSTSNFDSSGKLRCIFKADTNTEDTIVGANDPYVGMDVKGNVKLNYTFKENDVVQVYFRWRDLKFNTDGRPNCATVFFAGTSIYQTESGNAAYNNAYVSNLTMPQLNHNNYQLVTGTVPSGLVGKTLDYIRFDPINNGSAFDAIADGNSGFYIDWIYVGSAADAPYQQVTYKYKNATAGEVTSTEWVEKGGKPTNVPAAISEYPAASSTAPSRYRFLNTWSGKTAEQVKNTTINSATTFTADYVTQYRIVYKNYKTSYTAEPKDLSEYVDSGALPTRGTSDTLTESGNQRRYKVSTIRRETANGSVSYTKTADAYAVPVTSNVNFWFAYVMEYKVTFYKSDNSTVLASPWVKENQTPAKYTPDEVSGKTFVAWRQDSTTGTPVVEYATKITAPTRFYPYYLENSFVGADTSSVVVDRKVTVKEGTALEDHTYVVRLDLYHYGKELDGYIKIMDNAKEDFDIIGDVSVYHVPYLGNKVFEDEKLGLSDNEIRAKYTRQTTGGGNGFVFDIVKRSNQHLAWIEGKHSESGATDHHYYTMHLYREGYENDYAALSGTDTHQVVSNSKNIMQTAYLRETANAGSLTYPHGFKYVIFFEIRLGRDGTIGGNNVPLGEEFEHATVEYYPSLTATKPTTTIDLRNIHAAKGEDWPNANVEILYDFCPHDYYMDLYDQNVPYYVSRGNIVSGADRTRYGLISALRLKNSGKEGTVHEAVYGSMFSHGNQPVYARDAAGLNAYTKLGLPNTDVNAVRNEKVNILYTVKHDTLGKIVYETYCNYDGYEFAVKNRHNEVDVNYLVDHSVTITVTVTPVDTGHTDYFGRPTDDTVWTRTAKAYYFAPRFAIADSSNNITIETQREATSYNISNFIAMPSVEYGEISLENNAQRLQLDKTDASGAYSSATGHERIVYSFNNTKYKYEQDDITIINGIQRVGYVVSAINTPKRFASNVPMADRNLVQRYAYIIPSTTMTYDQNALTYEDISQWHVSTDANSRVSRAWQRYDADTRNANIIYGRDFTLLTDLRNGSDKKVGNLLDYNGGSYFTNVDDATTENRNEWGEFTFTGTGFDIYSRCGPDTGVLVAQVYDSTGKTLLQNIFSDTYLDNATIYQVPCVQWQAPSYGTYVVKFRAYYHAAFDHQLYKSGAKKAVMTEDKIRSIMGWDDSVPCTISLSESTYAVESRAAKSGDYDVYIDGIRIYNTMGELSKATDYVYADTEGKESYAAYAIYNYDKELNPKYFNVNEYIVDATNGDWFKELGTNDVTGLLYIAGSAGSVGDPEGDSNAGQNDGFVGITLCSTGQLYTIAEDYTDKNGNTFQRYFYVDKDGNKILDPETGCAIFQRSDTKKFYINTKTWTQITESQLMLILGNKLAFYDARYKTIGPAYEIYLTKGNGVAFNATSAASAVTAVHISLRSADGKAITPQVYDGSTWKTISVNYNTDYTEQYYDITAYVKSNSGNVYIRNAGDGIMSLMNVKVVGGDTPKVNTRMIMAALEVFQAPETPMEDSGMTLLHSLSLASDISVNYTVPVARMQGVESSYLRVELPKYEGNNLVGSEIVEIRPELRGNYYYFTLDGLTAVNMNDNLEATLYIVREGTEYVSPVDHYSIAAYAYTQLNKATLSPSLKALCAELLRYGASAQIFKGYRTDALANEEMTEEHKALLQNLEDVSFGYYNSISQNHTAPTIIWDGKSLDLGSTVSVKFIFHGEGYVGNVEDLYLTVSYVGIDGQEHTKEVRGATLYNEAQQQYAFTFDGLLAAELRSVLYVQVYEEGIPLSNTLVYSADTYGNGKTGTLGQLCKALFAYSDTAKAYFQTVG